MTDEELKAALAEIVRNAEAYHGAMGPTDDLQATVTVGVARAMLERLG